ncbi:flagellar hook-length control protein FliK [Tepidicella xavieri]|uniref:Flagellar hook-length control protein FliK n=1 Tax=Tepidicella xavieri TaxID=360241 RepID=A0A4R6U995_9BURK|nr:flagellar hook-length control protein FliK [Tepidicella xavieri]TDQ41389.1 flagellar hook-length control protein FliK [Tepidicella xavieri]
MKAEAVSPTRPPESTAQPRGPQKPEDTPADLFATLLLMADSHLAEPPSAGAETAPQDAAALTAAWAAGQALPDDLPPETTAEALPLPDDGLTTLSPSASDRRPDARPREDLPDAADRAPGQWVSTVAKARAKAPPPQMLSQLAQATLEAAGQPLPTERSAWHMNTTGQAGGLLSDALGSPEELDLGALGSQGGAERSGDSREQGQGQSPRGDSGRVVLDATGSLRQAPDSGATPRSFAAALGEALGPALDEAFEHLGAQVSLWAAGNAKKASLRLEAGLRQALDVDVSLQGDKAHLAFRTDDAQVRETLRLQAQEVLADMLARAGIALEGFSVGSQGRDGRGSAQEGSHRPASQTGAAEGEATRPVPPGLIAKVAGAGLSVYA